MDSSQQGSKGQVSENQGRRTLKRQRREHPPNNIPLSWSGEQRRFSIAQYNCQKDWKNVLSFLRGDDRGQPHKLYDVIAIQEPLLPRRLRGKEDPTQELPEYITSHFEFWIDEEKRHFGARNPRVCLFVNRRLCGTSWSHWHVLHATCDLLTIEIPTSHDRRGNVESTLLIHNVYEQPEKGKPSGLQTLYRVINEIEFYSRKDRVLRDQIVLGDMNIHNPLWGGHTAQHGRRSGVVLSIVEYLNMTPLLPLGAKTRLGSKNQKDSTIDLVFATPAISHRLLHCRTRPDLNSTPEYAKRSDHVPVETMIDLTLSEKVCNPDLRNWKKMNHELFLDSLQKRLEELPHMCNSNEEVDSFTKGLVEALTNSTMVSTRTIRPCIKSRSWIDDDCKVLMKETSRSKWRKSQFIRENNGTANPMLEYQYRRARNAKTNWTRKCKRVNERQEFEEVVGDRQGFEKHVRWLEQRQSPYCKETPLSSYGSKDKARAVLDHFFPTPPDVDLSDLKPFHDDDDDDPKHTEYLSEDEVEQAIERLQEGKTPGPDGIRSEALRLGKPFIIQPLLRLFQASITRGYCPMHFREFATKALRKPMQEDYTVAEAYKPMALRNTLSKVFEWILAIRIRRYAQKQGLLAVNHCGGSQGISLNDARHVLRDHVTLAEKQMLRTSLLVMDAPMAFEFVSHRRLVYILRKGKIPAWIINWIESFLSHRHTYLLVRDDNERNLMKRPAIPLSELGLPRSSALSKVLYDIYTAELLKNTNSKSLGCASDLNGYYSIQLDEQIGLIGTSRSIKENCNVLKEQLGRVEQWMLKHGRAFEQDDYKLLHFGMESECSWKLIPEYGSIKPRKSIEFLGMMLDHRLRWGPHQELLEQQMPEHLGPFHTFAKSSRYIPEQGLVRVFDENIIPQFFDGSSMFVPLQGQRNYKSAKVRVDKTINTINTRASRAISRGPYGHLCSPLVEYEDLCLYARGESLRSMIGFCSSTQPQQR